jgi:hypothetical protein
MTKSSTPKVASEKARHTRRETAPKLDAEKMRRTRRKTNSKVAAEKAHDADRKTTSVAVEKVRHRHGEIASKETAPKLRAEKTRHTRRETNSKVAAEKAHDVDRQTASVAVDGNSATKVAAEKSHDADRKATTNFEQLRATQVPASMRAPAERNVAQTRELYEGSAKALETVFESWENSLNAFGQAAVALNRKIINIAESNISSGFDLATSLAGAKNIAEAMEVQIAYCRKQFVELRMQAEEVRVLLQKVTASVVESIKAQ